MRGFILRYDEYQHYFSLEQRNFSPCLMAWRISRPDGMVHAKVTPSSRESVVVSAQQLGLFLRDIVEVCSPNTEKPVDFCKSGFCVTTVQNPKIRITGFSEKNQVSKGIGPKPRIFPSK